MKKLLDITRDVPQHWVGDGFPVRSLFSYGRNAAAVDPFLLFDYAGPHEFPPGTAPRGVGEHPHRGFETVTIVYAGELEHRDSGGNHGKIGPGDVQWMTAASGVVHEEFHSADFTRRGGTFQVIQLWVNLPAKLKMSPPRYQEILNSQIPKVPLPSGGGSVRVIAGEFRGTRGPAKTFTPVSLWDLQLTAGHTVELESPAGDTTLLVVQTGGVTVNAVDKVHPLELALFDRTGEDITITAEEDSRALFLAGRPLGEPVVGQGPFVMNTAAEIQQAVADYQSGR
ncbi:MAG TPA: pirin family protein, partial [Lacipirellulaceae bacterium]